VATQAASPRLARASSDEQGRRPEQVELFFGRQSPKVENRIARAGDAQVAGPGHGEQHAARQCAGVAERVGEQCHDRENGDENQQCGNQPKRPVRVEAPQPHGPGALELVD
jgi:hypothetical protein